MKTLYREVRSFGKGSPEDGSETWRSETTFVLVDDTDDEKYQEHCADEYGSQDYSYQFVSKEVLELSGTDITALKDALKGVN